MTHSSEKKKWQIALRRYVIERQRGTGYAPYFGIGIEQFRSWLQSQWDASLNWENFGHAWQITQVVPVECFDLQNDEDLRLCWNFLNIGVQKTAEEAGESARKLITAKKYFQELEATVKSDITKKMLEKIAYIEARWSEKLAPARAYLADHAASLEALEQYGEYEFSRLNSGVPLIEIQEEKAMLERFGK